MVSGSKVTIAYPSISFLFACLGGSLRVFPYLKNFVFVGNSLSIALVDFLPLLRQLIDWFKGLVRKQEIMSEVRLSELETGLSSNDNPVEAGGDTTVSAPREVRTFHALDEVYGLDTDTLLGSRISFNFQIGSGLVCLAKRNEPAISSPRRYASTRLLFCVVLGFPSTPLSWSC